MGRGLTNSGGNTTMIRDGSNGRADGVLGPHNEFKRTSGYRDADTGSNDDVNTRIGNRISNNDVNDGRIGDITAFDDDAMRRQWYASNMDPLRFNDGVVNKHHVTVTAHGGWRCNRLDST